MTEDNGKTAQASLEENDRLLLLLHNERIRRLEAEAKANQLERKLALMELEQETRRVEQEYRLTRDDRINPETGEILRQLASPERGA